MSAPSAHQIQVLRAAYAAFNARDIAAATALMTTDVTWPKAFKGGVVQGPDEIRAYWTEQWSEVDPHVEPTAFLAQADARILVDVHQVVRSFSGTVLGDEHVGHCFTFDGGLIRAMALCRLPAPAAT
jgi:hypothetical protein